VYFYSALFVVRHTRGTQFYLQFLPAVVSATNVTTHCPSHQEHQTPYCSLLYNDRLIHDVIKTLRRSADEISLLPPFCATV